MDPVGRALSVRAWIQHDAASFRGHFFVLLFFTPGILPSALRAGFAVRMRSCACVGQQRKVTRLPAGSRNARCVSGPVAVPRQLNTEVLHHDLRRNDQSQPSFHPSDASFTQHPLQSTAKSLP